MRRKIERLREFRDLFRSMFGKSAGEAMDIANRFIMTCRSLGGVPYLEWSWNPRTRFVALECVPIARWRIPDVTTRFRVKGTRFSSTGGAGKLRVSLAGLDIHGYEVAHADIEIPFRYLDELRMNSSKIGSVSLAKDGDQITLGTGAVEEELERIRLVLKPRETESGLRIEVPL